MTNRQSGSRNEQSHSQPGQEQQNPPGAGAAQRGTMNKPGDANESGSEGSTRRDDGAAVKGN